MTMYKHEPSAHTHLKTQAKHMAPVERTIIVLRAGHDREAPALGGDRETPREP
jgi:hypothetical protein